jgi:hypothetical protein
MDGGVEGGIQHVPIDDLGRAGGEFTQVFTAKDGIPEADSLFGQKFAGDSRTVSGRDLEALPARWFAMPLVVEEAGLAVGRGHEPESAAGDGEHGIEGVVEIIGDESGLINEKERDGGEAANVVGHAGKAHEPAAVREDQGVRVAAIAAGPDSQDAQEGGGLFDPLAGLASGGRGDENQGAGVMPSVMQRPNGGDGGLAELASAAEDEVVRCGAENAGLHGVGSEVEGSLSPLGRVGVEEGPRSMEETRRARDRFEVGVPVCHRSGDLRGFNQRHNPFPVSIVRQRCAIPEGSEGLCR